MDQFDRASEIENHFRHLAIDAARSKSTEKKSMGYCLECEEPIPEARIKAQPGCQYCIECAVELERNNKNMTR